MLQIVLLSAVMASAFAAPQSNIIFKNNITPEEAQVYLKALPFNEPKLATKTGVLPLVRFDDPRFRIAETGPSLGHYWKNGKEIENTDDFLEEVYQASQYHGQDGLGQYAYGYETPESSKVEDRQGSGVVTGSYVYKSPSHDLVKVKYWADSDGFHQEDNLPKVELKPAEETPALREARLTFEKAWKEAAEANSKGPVLPPGYYDSNYQGQASENRPVSIYAPDSEALRAYQQPQNQQVQQQGPQQPQQQYPSQQPQQQYPSQQPQQQYPSQQILPKQQLNSSPQEYKQQGSYNQPQQYNQQGEYSQQQGQYSQQQEQYSQQQGQYSQQPEQYSQQQGQYSQQPGQYSQQQGQYSQQQQQYKQQEQSGQQQQYKQQYGQLQALSNLEEAEPTGPPHGFFYSFNYPVSIIVSKNDPSVQETHTADQQARLS